MLDWQRCNESSKLTIAYHPQKNEKSIEKQIKGEIVLSKNLIVKATQLAENLSLTADAVFFSAYVFVLYLFSRKTSEFVVYFAGERNIKYNAFISKHEELGRYIRRTKERMLECPDITAYGVAAMDDFSFGFCFARESPVASTLHCAFMEKEGQTILSIICDSLRFDDRFINRFLKQYIKVLHQFILNSDKEIDEVDFILEEDREVILGLNKTEANYPNTTVFEVFLQQALHTPNRIALVHEDEMLTYRELLIRVQSCACVLQKEGIGLGTVVGLHMEKKCGLVIAMLAILAVRAIYLPLPNNATPERIKSILLDTKCNNLLVDQVPGYLHNFSDINCLVYDKVDTVTHFEEFDLPQYNRNDIMYIMYTSGSTGKPKGVAIQHYSIMNFLCAMKRITGFTEADAFLGMTSITFDISGLEIFLPLLNGARCVLLPTKYIGIPTEISSITKRNNITYLQATPEILDTLVRFGWIGRSTLTIISGGSALHYKLAVALLDRCKRLFNMYGPTETTIWSTTSLVTKEKVRIGTPIANTQVFILDNDKRLSPVGIYGELYIAGEGLSMGYINDPQLTTAAFPSLMLEGQSIRLYKTGDIVRLCDDGEIEYIGRDDRQIKINGQRIYINEIENVIRLLDQIQDVLVALRYTVLVAYIIKKQDKYLDEQEVRIHCLNYLSIAMIPSHVFFMEEWPLTENKKINIEQLPLPHVLERCRAVDQEASAVECKAIQTIKDVCRREDISLSERPLGIGITSLDALLIIHLLEMQGVELSIRDFFLSTSLGELIKCAKMQDKGKAESIDCPRTQWLNVEQYELVKRKLKVAPLYISELTETQSNMLQHTIFYKDDAYWVFSGFSLKTCLHKKACRRAFDLLVDECDRLRTVYFYHLLDKPIQVTCATLKASIQFRETNFSKIEEALSCAKKHFEFNLSKEVPFRLMVYDSIVGMHFFVFIYHHVVMDGESFDRLVSRFLDIYQRTLNNIKIESLSQKSFHEYFMDPRMAQKKRIDSRKDNRSGSSTHKHNMQARFTHQIKTSIQENIEKLSRKIGVSVNVILQEHWALSMMYVYQSDAYNYDLVVSLRPSEFYESIGMFVQPMPVCSKLETNSTYCDLVLKKQNMIANIITGDFASNDGSSANVIEHNTTNQHIIVFEKHDRLIQTRKLVMENQIEINDFVDYEITGGDLCVYFNLDDVWKLTVQYDKTKLSGNFILNAISTFFLLTNRISESDTINMDANSLVFSRGGNVYDTRT